MTSALLSGTDYGATVMIPEATAPGSGQGWTALTMAELLPGAASCVKITSTSAKPAAVSPATYSERDRAPATFCSGRNSNGQLGQGDQTDRLLPTQLVGGAVVVEAGDNHNCVIPTHTVRLCTGSNELGVLGLGDTMYRTALSSQPNGFVVADDQRRL